MRTRLIFFFNDTATTEIYTLSLHDALPIYDYNELPNARLVARHFGTDHHEEVVKPDAISLIPKIVQHYGEPDRKSTRLNSSHANISYAVFCLKKKIYVRSTNRTPTHHRDAF